MAAPAGLSPAEREVWRSTVAAAPAGLIAACDAPVLERYVVHVTRARCLELALAACDPTTEDGAAAFASLARAARAESATIVALARALRLTPHARTHAVTAARGAAKHNAAPTVDVLFDAE